MKRMKQEELASKDEQAEKKNPWTSNPRVKCTLTDGDCSKCIKATMADPTVTDEWQSMNVDQITEEFAKTLAGFARHTQRLPPKIVAKSLRDHFEMSPDYSQTLAGRLEAAFNVCRASAKKFVTGERMPAGKKKVVEALLRTHGTLTRDPSTSPEPPPAKMKREMMKSEHDFAAALWGAAVKSEPKEEEVVPASASASSSSSSRRPKSELSPRSAAMALWNAEPVVKRESTAIEPHKAGEFFSDIEACICDEKKPEATQEVTSFCICMHVCTLGFDEELCILMYSFVKRF